MRSQSNGDAQRDIALLIENIEKVIVGKREVVSLVIAALLSHGHVLLEDNPGLGKTMLARALARSIDCTFKRIQCTPDLLPVDITGYMDPRLPPEDPAAFKRGPVFANIVLADELNRAMPRTQSALLEAMGERQVTVEGQTHRLEEPFMVIATQNPVEYRGVNDLPEAQLDRFQMLLSPGYPSESEEKAILLNRRDQDPIDSLQPVIDTNRLAELMEEAAAVRLDEKLIDYILRIVRHTRDAAAPGGGKPLLMGASPRSALQLMHLSRAYALTSGRRFVIPDDVKFLSDRCLAHRVIPERSTDGETTASQYKSKVVRGLIDAVNPPA